MSKLKMTGPSGKLRILAEPCDQCPFEGRIELAPGGLAAHVRDCHRRGKERPFVCHKTLPSVCGRRGQTAVCAGFHKRYPECSAIQQIAERLGLVERVDGPPAPTETPTPAGPGKDADGNSHLAR